MGSSWRVRKANARSARFAWDDTLKTMDFWGGKRVVLCTTPTSQHQGCGAPGALIWLGATLSHPAARKSAAHQNGAPGSCFWSRTKAVGALRQALALRGAGAPLELWSAALRPSPLRAETSGRMGACCFGGSFDYARIEFILRWQELWPRSAQDDILFFICSGLDRLGG